MCAKICCQIRLHAWAYSASCIRSSSSWKAARSQKHLEGVDEGPLGVRHHKGSPNRFQDVVPHTPHYTADQDRVKRTPEQRSSSRGNKPSERVLLKSLPGPKKGRRAETRNEPKVPEQFCSDTTLQDGGNPYFEGPDTTRRLVGKSGSEGCLLCSPDPPLSSSIPQIQLPGEVLSVHLPPIWPVIGSLGLYQDPKASISSPPGDGSAPNSIHRRHPSPGGVPGTSKESCGGRSLPPIMSWVSDKLKEISAGTSTIYGIPGPDSGHYGHGIETPSGENEKDSCGGTKHGNCRTYLSPCHSKAGGKDECNISCRPTSPTVLSPSTDCTLRSTEQQLSVLRDTGFPLPLQQGGTEVVGQSHGEMEWEITPFQGDRYDNRLRCLPDGLGCSMSKSTDRRSVVSFREPDAYKLSRVVGSHTGSSDISETQNQVVSPPEVGQHLSSGIHKQPGRAPELVDLAKTLWMWCLERNIHITAQHLPGAQNHIADAESRTMVDRSDWKLNPILFKRIVNLFGPIEVDLFASRLTAQCPVYFSWRPDPYAAATDDFLQDWSQIWGYANPPWSLIGQVLSQVQVQQAYIILVAPVWKTQPWYPLLLGMLRAYPYLIRHHQIMLNRDSESLSPQLAVWPISGRDTESMNFQRKLHPSCSNPGELRQIGLTTHSSGSGIAGVIHGVQIPFRVL